MIALHTAVAIIVAIGLIIRFRVDPVISLIIASLYLGIASGVGLMTTIEAIAGGFGEIMAEVGLLIGFGVLIGALLQVNGTFQRLVDVLVRAVGATRLPYTLSTMLSTILPSIYVDVQVVLAAPVARSAAPRLGRIGLPLLASALGAGIFAGYVFVIPGLAAISIAGLLDIPLGTWLLYGIVIGPLTAILTSLVMRLVLSRGYWKPDTDEEHEEHDEVKAAAEVRTVHGHKLPLVVLLLPILVPLVMIAFGAFADLLDFSTPLIAFLGNANFALFVGLLGAYLLSRGTAGLDRTREAMEDGFHTTGEILLVTGVGGSLGAVITETTLDKTLAGFFEADTGAPVILSILLAWFVAALLHLAIGSVSVAAIAASGIIAPILGSLSVSPVVIGLAIASGAMFALQVNSNFFWMFKALLGLSTKGALKTLTLATSVASVVSLPMVLVVSFIA